ncbi:hypothetical protein [Segatella copri]|uniref:hypothetical protein n=1 Tax=Segatella copri TaxID=165179 RepID=UPI001D1722F2|nr:hypothetical protein [Segatella copri]
MNIIIYRRRFFPLGCGWHIGNKGCESLQHLGTVHGHNEFANKDCPCFDVKEEFGE